MLLSNKQKGFALPYVLIFIFAFVAVPLVFWVATYKSSGTSVKGAESVEEKVHGVTVNIISKFGSWEMSKYLCESRSECVSGLNSGKSLGSLNGGSTLGKRFNLEYDDAWEDYSYVKLFIRPGWGSGSHKFTLKFPADSEGVERVELAENVEVVLVPIELIKESKAFLLVFSDTF